MSKIEYDGNLVSTLILTEAFEVKKFTDAAFFAIEKVKLNESYNIGSIKSNLESCKASINKYCNWINDVKKNYNECEERASEIFSNISVPKIPKKGVSIR